MCTEKALVFQPFNICHQHVPSESYSVDKIQVGTGDLYSRRLRSFMYVCFGCVFFLPQNSTE